MSVKGFPGRMTLLQQWVGATVLAILPLLVAVSYAAYALHQQTVSQRQLVQRMDRLGGHSSAVVETVRELTRSVRQYVLLQDDSFLELYRQKAATLADPLQYLRETLRDTENPALLDSIEQTVRSLEARMANARELTEEGVSRRLSGLVTDTETLKKAVAEHRREALASGEREFKQTVDLLFFLTVLTLPGTFLLMAIGTYHVSRPLWRLSQSIRRLGQQQWETPIRVDGPADLVALGDNLDWMRRQVIASDTQKTAFIQHVTHELKSPLAAIIEAGELLRDEVPGKLEPEQKPILDILCSNARHLQDHIQQLLNYNAVSHGIVAQRQDVDLLALCHTIRARLESTGTEKRLHWDFSGEPEVIPGDARLLEMILTNLLRNAFQFTGDGGRVAVHWQQDGDSWQLSVADTGPGIEPDEIGHIFTPFYKGRSGPGEALPRNGIGLAIVWECVQLLRGQIDVSSTPGAGTSFEMVFPLTAEGRQLC